MSKTMKFDGKTYHLARVYMYKGQAQHEANYVREHGGLARVIPGTGMAGDCKMKNCWRVYTKE